MTRPGRYGEAGSGSGEGARLGTSHQGDAPVASWWWRGCVPAGLPGLHHRPAGLRAAAPSVLVEPWRPSLADRLLGGSGQL